MKKIVYFFTGLLFSIFVFSSCNQNKIEHSKYGVIFGTTYHIKYISEHNTKYTSAFDSIFQSINRSVSNYQKNSKLYKINKGNTTITVDKTLKDVFSLSKKVYIKTNGYFDPTVGKIVNAYGFGSEKKIKNCTQKKNQQMMKSVGFYKVLLENDKIIKRTPNIYMDFNAIAKGYAVDRVGQFLKQKGIENYLVEIGGEILTFGKNIDGKKWIIAIDQPQEKIEKHKTSLYIKLSGEAIATSGNYRKFRIDNNTGKKIVHTINPLTGFAEQNDMLSASVIAKKCAVADAYATAFMSMGYQKSITFLKENKTLNLKVFFIYLDKQNNVKTFLSSGIDNVW